MLVNVCSYDRLIHIDKYWVLLNSKHLTQKPSDPFAWCCLAIPHHPTHFPTSVCFVCVVSSCSSCLSLKRADLGCWVLPCALPRKAPEHLRVSAPSTSNQTEWRHTLWQALHGLPGLQRVMLWLHCANPVWGSADIHKYIHVHWAPWIDGWVIDDQYIACDYNHLTLSYFL